MQANHDAVMKVELVFEGGYVDNKKDPGGATNEGITQATYNAWRTNNKLPIQSVKLMTPAERDSIYDGQYLTPIKFADLPNGMDLVMADSAINSGVHQAVLWAQRSSGSLYTGKYDGIMGEHTMAALQSVNDVDAWIETYLNARMSFLKALKTWSTFGNGWTNRINQVRTLSESWAKGSIGTAEATPVSGSNAKADIRDAQPIPSTTGGGAVAGVGTTVATVSATSVGWIGAIKGYLSPLSSFIPHIDAINAHLDHITTLITSVGGIAGLAVGVGGGVWLWYANRRAAELKEALGLVPQATPPVAPTAPAPVVAPAAPAAA